MERISNELLVTEAIRRFRKREQEVTSRTCPDGTRAEMIFSALLGSGWIEAKELRYVLNSMLDAGTIVIIGSASLHLSHTREFSSSESRRGWIRRFHPDAPLRQHQCFTENGTPMQIQRREGRQIYPHKGVTYWFLNAKMFYLFEDGLPQSVQNMLKRNPIDCY